jgi:hypothetical protein
MQIDYLVLADAVAVADGKHYIHGGGWDTLFATTFPAQHPALGVAARLRIPWQETNQQFVLEVDVLLDGNESRSIFTEPLRGIVNAQRPPHALPGSDVPLHLALGFTNLRFESPGRYIVVLRIDGKPLSQSPFNVIAVSELSEQITNDSA